MANLYYEYLENQSLSEPEKDMKAELKRLENVKEGLDLELRIFWEDNIDEKDPMKILVAWGKLITFIKQRNYTEACIENIKEKIND